MTAPEPQYEWGIAWHSFGDIEEFENEARARRANRIFPNITTLLRRDVTPRPWEEVHEPEAVQAARLDISLQMNFDHEGVCARDGEWCPTCRQIAHTNLEDAEAGR